MVPCKYELPELPRAFSLLIEPKQAGTLLQQLPKPVVFPRGWGRPEGCGSLGPAELFPVVRCDARETMWVHTKYT